MSDVILRATVGAIIIMSVLSAISSGSSLSAQLGPSLNGNWYDAMMWIKNNTPQDSIVVYWWDQGHWITGIAERGAYADGAHCPLTSCKPYPLNTRIVDVGKVLTTNDESLAIQILSKYMNFTEAQCELNKRAFGNIVPCKSPSEMYFLAASDLISKYPWPSYFGSLWPTYSGEGRQQQFFQIGLQQLKDGSGNVVGYYDQCLRFDASNNCQTFNFLVIEQNGKLATIYQNRNFVENTAYFIGSDQKTDTTENATVGGTFWIDPSYGFAFFMTPEVQNSVFTRLYFHGGKGLDHFKQVYSNGEVKVFKVNFQ
ncbi:MAG: hypothetical protein HY051_01640 [Candidatus Aenigmarchaeota archaeon]|nr:hypothetical protein [Candidatus Aenigmarchaeota archaeon]